MDLFFDCVKPKKVDKVTIDEAIGQVFSTSSILAVLDLYVHDKVVARIECDARGAAVYKFKTLSGPHVIAETFYRPARAQLENRCTYEGPPESPLSQYVPPKESIRVVVNVLSKFELPRADEDEDGYDYEYI